MSIELESMALEMPVVEGHPNREGFRGVLTLVDVASDRAPSGAKGHRVVLTRGAAEAALPSLMGMALDYAPTLDRHDVRRKVGVITRADIVGKTVELGGHLFARDFPEIVAEIEKNRRASLDVAPSAALRAGWADGPPNTRTELGMSYEITEARVADARASVWTLTHVVFTGAAILRRDKAAYRDTWIELSSG